MTDKHKNRVKYHKGYLSFVLAVVSALIFIILIKFSYLGINDEYANTDAKLITTENVYAHLLDYKHAAVKVAEWGLNLAFDKYIVQVVASDGVDAINVEEFKKDAKNAIYGGLVTLESEAKLGNIGAKNKGMLKMWCGKPSGIALSVCRRKSETLGSPQVPIGAYDIINPVCKEYIHVSLNIGKEIITARAYFDRIGFTYCENNICDVGYLPNSIKVETSVKIQ